MHGLHVSHDKLHLQSHPLDAHRCVTHDLHSARLLAALCRYNLAPSSLFFLRASFAIFIYFWLYFIDFVDYRAMRFEAIFISIRVSSIVGFFGGGGLLPIIFKFRLQNK